MNASRGDRLAVRGFVARILGLTAERRPTVDRALQSIELAVARRAALVICGEGDLVPMARALHHRTLGPDAPFIACDPRRGDSIATVRTPANHKSGCAAFHAAQGGTLCLRARRLPRDFPSVVSLMRDPGARVSLVVCWPRHDIHPLLVAPSPLIVPPLRGRAAELPQIVDEYAADAIATLNAPPGSFTNEDRTWVLAHAASSLDEIEKATLRIVALATSPSVTRAAARLEMAQVSLIRWIARRAASLPQVQAATADASRLAWYLRPRPRSQPRRSSSPARPIRRPRRVA